MRSGAGSRAKELGNERHVDKGCTCRRESRKLLEAALHVLDEGDGVEEFALALRALLDPPFVPVLLALLDAVDVVLEAGDYLGSVAVARELALATTAVDLSIELGVVDDRQEDGVGHPLGLLGEHRALVRRTTGVLVNPKALFVQELEATHLALLDLPLRSVLGAVVDAVDVVGRSRDLLEPLRCVVAGERFVASLAVDVEGEVLDHVRLEGNVRQTGHHFAVRVIVITLLTVTVITVTVIIVMRRVLLLLMVMLRMLMLMLMLMMMLASDAR